MEENVAGLWAQGGWGMYPLTLLALVAVPLAVVLPVVALAKPRSTGLLFAFVLFCVGVGGMAAGLGVEAFELRNVEAAVAMVNPVDKKLILMAGQSECAVPKIYAFVFSLLPLVGAAACVGVALSRSKPGQPRPALLGVGAVLAVAVLAAGYSRFESMVEDRADLKGHLAAAMQAKDAEHQAELKALETR